jgi:hypothetical protein
LANLFLIKNVVSSPHHIGIPVPGEEFQSIDALYKLADQVQNVQINTSFDKSKANQAAENFAKAFTSLSQKRSDKVCDHGISFAQLHSFLEEAAAKLPAKIEDNSHHEMHTMSASVTVAEDKT